jgi:hypothetical protein
MTTATPADAGKLSAAAKALRSTLKTGEDAARYVVYDFLLRPENGGSGFTPDSCHWR